MTTLHKVLLTILLAVAAVLLLGSGPHWRERLVEIDPPHTYDLTPDIEYYQRVFRIYNEAYFHNRLNTPTFRMDEATFESSTMCLDSGTNCVMNFNPRYNLAPRDALLHELHEMCHVKTWGDDQSKLILGPDDLTRHGKHWRGCMLDLDNQGAWRAAIIDFYQGTEK